MFDPWNIEKISPEVWRYSVLSVARFTSGCKINGVSYVLDHDTDYLVRFDVWQRDLKDKKKQKAVAAAEKKRWTAAQQAGLFNIDKIPGF